MTQHTKEFYCDYSVTFNRYTGQILSIAAKLTNHQDSRAITRQRLFRGPGITVQEIPNFLSDGSDRTLDNNVIAQLNEIIKFSRGLQQLRTTARSLEYSEGMHHDAGVWDVIPSFDEDVTVRTVNHLVYPDGSSTHHNLSRARVPYHKGRSAVQSPFPAASLVYAR